MKKAILGSLTAVSVVVAGTLLNAVSATAAALTGQFQFSSEVFNPVTTISITKNTLSFNPDPGKINLASQTGTFVPFNTSSIFSTPALTLGATGTNAKMLDLGNTGIAGSTSDNKDIFSLTKVANAFDMFTFGGIFPTTSISLAVDGFFTSADNQKSVGSGILTFQLAGLSKDQIETKLNNNETISGITFSGAYISAKAVPEPASILGLGLVGGGLVASRRRKAAQMS